MGDINRGTIHHASQGIQSSEGKGKKSEETSVSPEGKQKKRDRITELYSLAIPRYATVSKNPVTTWRYSKTM